MTAASKNLTIVIPFYNGHSTLDRLLKSIPEEIFAVIVVDDQSDVPLDADRYLKEYGVEVHRLRQKGYFAGAVNRGIQECHTDVLILNQDTRFENEEWLDLIEKNRDRYAMIGERIRGTHPSFGDLGYIHGTFLWLRRDAIEAVGLLNEKEYPLWGSTAEYQWRVARKNFRVLPLENIPGFRHERTVRQKYGSSIQQLLEKEPEKKNLLTRTPPLLSVIVPVYNYGPYLSDCINSLIGGPTNLGEMPGQTLQSFEIIIVDDASTDTTPEYIKQVVDISKGIRAYRLEKNVGTARALNYGIERAVGKYITFLSADDMREPDSLENLVRVCEQNPHSFAYDDVWLFHTHKRIKKWELPDYDFETLLYKNHVHAGIVFPREAWVDVGGYPAIMNDGREDWAFNVALGIKGWCAVHVKQFGYLYRREGQNRTEKNSTEEHRQKFLGKIMSLFPEVYGGYRPMACCGKGSNKKSNNGKVSSMVFRGAMMADSIGKEGMVKIEYLGSQMMFTISGDVTNLSYTFGKDRQKSWVDKRDIGTRDGKSGFLSKKDRLTHGWLYRVVGQADVVVAQELVQGFEVTSEIFETVVVSDAVAVSTPTSQAALVPSSEGNSLLLGTLSVAHNTGFPDPTDLNVEEIKRLTLTREQWEAVYKAEMAGRNRKGAVMYIEEMLASLS